MSAEACLEQLRAFAGAHPGYPDAWCNLGLLLAHLKREAEALQAIGQALDLNPELTQAGITRCFLLGEMGDADEGFRAFRQLHARNPEDFEAIFGLGVYCMRHGWKDTGLEQLLRAEADRPELPFVLCAVAGAFRELGDESSALPRWQRAQEILRQLAIPGRDEARSTNVHVDPLIVCWKDPGLSKVPMLLADHHCFGGSPEMAEEILLSSITSAYPGHAHLMTHLGRIVRAGGRSSEAEGWLAAAIRLDGSFFPALLELGFLHAENGDADGACAAFRKAVQLRPLFPDFRYYLGISLVGCNRVDAAIEEFRRALVLHPAYGHAALHLAGALLSLRRPEEALDILSAATASHWPEALLLTAEAHSLCGRELEAHRALEQILAIDPSHHEATDLLRSLVAST